MKGILNREDLDLIPRIVLIPVRADHLQRTLHRLGSRVAEKRALQPADLGQPFRQRDRGGRVVEGCQPGDERLAEQQRGIDLDGIRERQSTPLLAEGAEQVRRPRLGIERRIDLCRRLRDHPRDTDLLGDGPVSRLLALKGKK